jgi:transposase
MFSLDAAKGCLIGPKGQLQVPATDQAVVKLVMLLEGQCLGLGGTAAARKHGYSKPRYFQLVRALGEHGLAALTNHKRGPKRCSQRTDEAVRQVIRHRFLDPEASTEVIAQKLRQTGLALSIRTVRRVLEDYGLQKKTLRRGAQVLARRR